MRNDRIIAHYNHKNQFDYLHSIAEPPEDVATHIHNQFELYFFLSGDLTTYIEGNAYSIRKGDIIIINNNELHRSRFHSKIPYERIVIHFNHKYLSGFQPDNFDLLDFLTRRKLGTLNQVKASKVDTAQIFSFFNRIDQYILDDPEEKKIIIKLFFIELLVLLHKIYKEKGDFLSTPKHHEKKIKQILLYINDKLEEKISLEILEKEFFINRYYLCHLFKECTGFTIMEYITHKRIIKAKQLLLEGFPVIDTCFEVGFGDYSNFYKIFKRLTGLTPKQFIKKH